jgi:hypothetical protein
MIVTTAIRIVYFPPDLRQFGVRIIHGDKDGGEARRVVGFDNIADLGANLTEIFSLLDSHSNFCCLLGVSAAFEVDATS